MLIITPPHRSRLSPHPSTRRCSTALKKSGDHGVKLILIPANIFTSMFREIRMRMFIVEASIKRHDDSFYFAYDEATDIGVRDREDPVYASYLVEFRVEVLSSTPTHTNKLEDRVEEETWSVRHGWGWGYPETLFDGLAFFP